MIKDCKQNDQATTTKWRLGGEAAPKNQPFQMRVTFDLDNFFIDWYVEDTIVASSKLPQMHYHQGFRVAFSLFHTEDSVLLNE